MDAKHGRAGLICFAGNVKLRDLIAALPERFCGAKEGVPIRVNGCAMHRCRSILPRA
jgi:hypothetical protein